MQACSKKLVALLLLIIASMFQMFYLTNGYSYFSGLCAVNFIIAISPTAFNGTSVQIISQPLLINVTTDIPYALPHECSENFELCSIQHIETASELTLFLPSTDGFVRMAYNFTSGTTSYTYFPIQRDCSIVQAFHSSQFNNVLFDCLRFRSTVNTGDLRIVEADAMNPESQFRYSNSPETLSSFEALSRSVFVASANRIFCAESNELLSASTGPTDPLSLHPEFSLNNCGRVKQIEAIGDRVYLYCENELSWAVLADTREKEHYPNYTFPCFDNERVVIANNQLIFNGKTLPLPFSSLAYGMCSNGIFFAQAEDGSLHSFDLTTEGLSPDKLTTCPQDQTCLKPVFNEDRSVFTYFDHSNSTVNVFNLTGSCGGGEVELSNAPNILYVATSEYRVAECSCQEEPSTAYTEFIMTTVADIVNRNMMIIRIAVPILVAVLVLALVITVIVIIIVFALFKRDKTVDGIECEPMECEDEIGGDVVTSDTGYALISKSQLESAVTENDRNNDRQAVAYEIRYS